MNGGVSCNWGLFFTLHSSLFPYFLHFSINTLSFTFRQVRTLVLAPVSIILIKWHCNLALMQPWRQRAQRLRKNVILLYILQKCLYIPSVGLLESIVRLCLPIAGVPMLLCVPQTHPTPEKQERIIKLSLLAINQPYTPNVLRILTIFYLQKIKLPKSNLLKT